jgi:hypothetical protein
MFAGMVKSDIKRIIPIALMRKQLPRQQERFNGITDKFSWDVLRFERNPDRTI